LNAKQKNDYERLVKDLGMPKEQFEKLVTLGYCKKKPETESILKKSTDFINQNAHVLAPVVIQNREKIMDSIIKITQQIFKF